MKIDRSHEALGICYNAAKSIGNELKDIACLERTRLRQSDIDQENEADEDFSLNISYEAAFQRTTKSLYNFVA